MVAPPHVNKHVHAAVGRGTTPNLLTTRWPPSLVTRERKERETRINYIIHETDPRGATN